MNISYLISQYPGVSHTFIHREILALRDLGHTLEVASINPPNCELSGKSQVFYVKPAGWRCALISHLQVLTSAPLAYLRGLLFSIRLAVTGMPGSLRCMYYFVEAVMIGVWMKRNRSTHLHVHFGGPAATVGLILSRTFPFSFSITIHGPDEFFDVSDFFLKEKIQGAAFICAIGFYARSQLIRLVTPEHWGKITVSPLGVDVDEFSSSTPELTKPHVDLVCVGRLVPAKGQHILLQAVQRLVLRGRNVRLHLVGDGPDRRSLESFAQLPELTGRVVFAGAVPAAKVRDVLAQADIFVLPSFAEGIPVALMEAMSMEIPCVSTCICGIPELIDNGVSGILVAPSDVDALTEALDRLIADSALRGMLGRNGRERILDKYQLRPNVKRLAGIFAARIPSAIPALPRLAETPTTKAESIPFA